MAAIEDIRQLLVDLEGQATRNSADKALIASFDAAVKDIARSLADAVACMERPKQEADEMAPVVQAIDRMCMMMDKPDMPEAPADFGPIVGAINAAAAARPMHHPGWDFDFDYSQVNGKLTGMRARPVVTQ